MDPLATPDDVAQALGLADAAALSASQGYRVDGLLARVSREFRRESERMFTPGTFTVRLVTVGDRVRLPETVDSVDDVASVVDRDGDDVAYTLDGQDLVLKQYGRDLWSGVEVTVTYTSAAPVPTDVVAAVAGVVARHLTVDPASVAAQSTEMSAGPFRTRYAEWTSSTSLLTADECELARSYRYPGTAVIITRP